MASHDPSNTRGPEGLPVSPSLDPVLGSIEAEAPQPDRPLDRRTLYLCALAVGLGIVAAFAAEVLLALIGLITNLVFYGRVEFELVPPGGHELGLLVIVIPVIGALIIGVMARYGSKAIRGHGIPEAMEGVLKNQSRIPARIIVLKPLSSAIAIGTGGPFGAEGPIIATGGALGSVLGQLLHTTPMERKTLLAAGAAAGMTATFGTPIAAVLLAIELLLFEFRPRSFIPVAFASTAATGVRLWLHGVVPAFPMPDIEAASSGALLSYVVLGALIGLAAVGVTRLVYLIEDGFEKLPVHWMWWPAIGAVAVGVIGYFVPETLGVGYESIEAMISGTLPLQAVAILCVFKLMSWSIYLGSGTSGGTLAPLFIIGGALGLLLGAVAAQLLPGLGIDPRVAALVGMAAMFAGASRALLASVVFAFEATLQTNGLLPLLGGCAAAYMVSQFLMRHTIMTIKIERRGVRVPTEYAADVLDELAVHDVASRNVVVLHADDSLDTVRAWMQTNSSDAIHQGFPVVNAKEQLVGVLTRRNLLDSEEPGDRRIEQLLRRPPVIVYSDCSLRNAVDHMVRHDLGRLPVVTRDEPGTVVGILTRSDILSAYRERLGDTQRGTPAIRLGRLRSRDQRT